MCIIMYKPSGTEMPSVDLLAFCWKNNPDGAGIMYQSKQRDNLFVVSGLMTLDSLFSEINKIDDIELRNVGIHFRKATSGPINEEMCHPFFIGGYKNRCSAGAIMHNGDLTIRPRNANSSDTETLVHDVLTPIFEVSGEANFLSNPKIDTILRTLCTSGNRYLIMNKNTVKMYSDDWLERDGVWWSKSSIKKYDCPILDKVEGQ